MYELSVSDTAGKFPTKVVKKAKRPELLQNYANKTAGQNLRWQKIGDDIVATHASEMTKYTISINKIDQIASTMP